MRDSNKYLSPKSITGAKWLPPHTRQGFRYLGCNVSSSWVGFRIAAVFETGHWLAGIPWENAKTRCLANEQTYAVTAAISGINRTRAARRRR